MRVFEQVDNNAQDLEAANRQLRNQLAVDQQVRVDFLDNYIGTLRIRNLSISSPGCLIVLFPEMKHA